MSVSKNDVEAKIDRIDLAYDRAGYAPVLLSGDVARILNCTVSHVYRLVRQNAFEVLGDRPHTGKPIRVERRAIVEYIVRRG